MVLTKPVLLTLAMALLAGFSSCTLVSQEEAESLTEVAAPPANAPHTPISINGNGDFTPANGVTRGAGTKSDPYMIEGWDIDLSSSYGITGIDIKLTSSHFVIRGVSIHGGDGSGIKFFALSNGVIEEVAIANVSYGIMIHSSGRLALSRNVVSGARHKGIEIENAWELSLNGNTVANSASGLNIARGVTNLVARNNQMQGNDRNFGWLWDSSAGVPDIDPSNTVDGKAIYFIVREQGRTVPSDAGYVAAVRSQGITVKGLTLQNNHQGIVFVETTGSTIEGIHLSDLDVGIYFVYGSDGNRIVNNRIEKSAEAGINHVYSGGSVLMDNTFVDNKKGLEFYRVEEKERSLVYHNNFFDSPAWEISSQERYLAQWDNGIPDGGNFWNDYAGADANGDGVGDTPYVRQVSFHQVEDRFPFMEANGWLVGAGAIAPQQLPTTTPLPGS